MVSSAILQFMNFHLNKNTDIEDDLLYHPPPMPSSNILPTVAHLSTLKQLQTSGFFGQKTSIPLPTWSMILSACPKPSPSVSLDISVCREAYATLNLPLPGPKNMFKHRTSFQAYDDDKDLYSQRWCSNGHFACQDPGPAGDLNHQNLPCPSASGGTVRRAHHYNWGVTLSRVLRTS